MIQEMSLKKATIIGNCMCNQEISFAALTHESIIAYTTVTEQYNKQYDNCVVV